MNNHDLERTLAYGVGVSAYAMREYQQASFVKLARRLYTTQHEQEAFITGYLAAAMNDVNNRKGIKS